MSPKKKGRTEEEAALDFNTLVLMSSVEKAALISSTKEKNESVAKQLEHLSLFKIAKRANVSPSWVWDHAVLVKDAKPVLCLVCGGQYVWGGTSNVGKHVKTHGLSDPKVDAEQKERVTPNLLEKQCIELYRSELERAAVYFVIKTMKAKSIIQSDPFMEMMRVATGDKNLRSLMTPSTLNSKLTKESDIMRHRVILLSFSSVLNLPHH